MLYAGLDLSRMHLDFRLLDEGRETLDGASVPSRCGRASRLGRPSSLLHAAGAGGERVDELRSLCP